MTPEVPDSQTTYYVVYIFIILFLCSSLTILVIPAVATGKMLHQMDLWPRVVAISVYQ